MATKINVTSKKGNKLITQALNNINENVADSDISRFIVSFAALSNNTLKKIEKVEKTRVQAAYSIIGGENSDTITCDDGLVTIDAAGGNDLISLGANAENCTIYAGTGSNTIYGNGGAHLYSHWGLAHDTIFGFSTDSTINISSAQPFTTNIDSDGAVVISGATANLYIKGEKLPGATGNSAADFAGFSDTSNFNIVSIGQNSLMTNLDNEQFYISKELETYKVRWAETTVTSFAENHLAAGATLNAQSGNDTFYVGENVAGMYIAGGAKIDVISIQGANRNYGNVYVCNAGDSRDSIYGWGDYDSLIVGSDCFVSVAQNLPNGEDFRLILCDESANSTVGGVFFYDLKPGAQINVFKEGRRLISDDDNFNSPYTFKRVMCGLEGRRDTIYNIYDAETGKLPKSGKLINGVLTDIWTIDGGYGNDTVTNEGSYVVIVGGDGYDTICNSGNCVTIIGGAGNDTICNSGNCVTIIGGAGNDTISLASSSNNNVIQYTQGDGNETIIGYNETDSIFITADSDTAIEGDIVRISNAFEVSVGGSIINFQRPDDLPTWAGTRFNIFTNGKATPLIAPKKILNNTAALTADYDFRNFEINFPTGNYKINLVNNTTDFDFTAESYPKNKFDNCTVYGGTGACTIAVQSAGVLIDGEASAERIYLVNGTNVINGVRDASKAVTVYAGFAGNHIYAESDCVVVGSDTVLASHLYQISATTSNSPDSIWGFNEFDTLQILGDFTSYKAAYVISKQDYVISLESSAAVRLVNCDGGKRLNVIDSDGAVVPVGQLDNGVYVTPKILNSTADSDTLTNYSDGFTINANSGDDVIYNVGASNVSIFGSVGDDTIYLQRNGNRYGQNVTINTYKGNNSVFCEFLETVEGEVTIQAADPNAPAHIFNYNHIYAGSDTICFATANDTFYSYNNYPLSTQIEGDDLVLRKKGYDRDSFQYIILKDFASDTTKTYSVVNAGNNAYTISAAEAVV